MLETTAPIDRTPGKPGSDKNDNDICLERLVGTSICIFVFVNFPHGGSNITDFILIFIFFLVVIIIIILTINLIIIITLTVIIIIIPVLNLSSPDAVAGAQIVHRSVTGGVAVSAVDLVHFELCTFVNCAHFCTS